jgi:signal peptidase I
VSPRTRRLAIELGQVAVLALVLYLALTFAVQTVRVLGSSMYPTLTNQSYLIAAKLPYRLHDPQRGDIVILRDPEDSSQDFIKRVIGLPGERILIRGGHIYINGRMLVEPYLHLSSPWVTQANWPDNGNAVTLGPDEYFVMGDNRNNSSDSRVFGPIHRNSIEADAWIRLLPLPDIGMIGGPRPYISSRTGTGTPS